MAVEEEKAQVGQMALAIAWGEDDLKRAIKMVQEHVEKLKAAANLAEEQTVPATSFHVPEPFDLIEAMRWPSSHDLGSLQIDGSGAWEGATSIVRERCHGQPKLILAVIHGLDRAIKTCEDIRTRRLRKAQSIVDEQLREVHEVRALFVAEELKKSNDQ